VVVVGVTRRRVSGSRHLAGPRLATRRLGEELCRQHLSPHKAPRYWEFVEQSPMTASGKVQKFAPRDRFIANAGMNEKEVL